jgi:hypothetical protein
MDVYSNWFSKKDIWLTYWYIVRLGVLVYILYFIRSDKFWPHSHRVFKLLFFALVTWKLRDSFSEISLPNFSFLPVFIQKLCIQFYLLHTSHKPLTSHSSLFDNTTNSWQGFKAMKATLCSFLQSPVPAPLLGPNINSQHPILKYPEL